jgi:acyl-CoA thioesterase
VHYLVSVLQGDELKYFYDLQTLNKYRIMNIQKDQLNNDPFAHMLGIVVEENTKGFARCSVTITENMMNFLGTVHGGLLFTLADAAFAAASNTDHTPSFALDISGSFMRPAKVGEKVAAEAHLIHTTKRTGIYRMDLTCNGALLATFNGTVFRKTE